MKRDQFDSWGVEDIIEDKVSTVAYKKYSINKAVDETRKHKKGEVIVCPICSVSFNKTSPNKIFCSKSCMLQYNNQFGKFASDKYVKKNSKYDL